ncbi:diguanylate cyclase [Deinococcus sp. HMF7620]|uniref:Diguanylate cyclase n=1 Tax=Deinococcus arboris TaxID=2682977 RepID=A0A7C9HSJ6_9DEIO|nr:sensor domain-containing diguanylate cyclase [Deinococcus arboris]MVN87673.1 diguanylate cyclase [Deinococcus arboris]
MAVALDPREEERLADLHDLRLLDTPREPQFDRIMGLAAQHFSAPYGSITLVDRDRQWFKATVGFRHSEDPRQDSICALVIGQPGVTVIEDAARLDATAHMRGVTHEPHIRFYAGAPVVTETGHAVGTICVIDQEPRPFTAADRTTLSNFAELVASELHLRRLTRRLYDQTLRDDLTGLATRRAFMRAVFLAQQEAAVTQTPVVVGLLDLHQFGALNATHGPAAGDALLRRVGQTAQSLLRSGEQAGRLKADQFTLLFTGPDALLRAQQVSAELLVAFPDRPGSVGLSLGLVEVPPHVERPDPDDLLSYADQAMYIAKKGGLGVMRLSL